MPGRPERIRGPQDLFSFVGLGLRVAAPRGVPTPGRLERISAVAHRPGPAAGRAGDVRRLHRRFLHADAAAGPSAGMAHRNTAVHNTRRMRAAPSAPAACLSGVPASQPAIEAPLLQYVCRTRGGTGLVTWHPPALRGLLPSAQTWPCSVAAAQLVSVVSICVLIGRLRAAAPRRCFRSRSRCGCSPSRRGAHSPPRCCPLVLCRARKADGAVVKRSQLGPVLLSGSLSWR